MTIQDVNYTLSKYQYYIKLWRLVRSLKENGQPLPEEYNHLRALLIDNRGKLMDYEERRRI